LFVVRAEPGAQACKRRVYACLPSPNSPCYTCEYVSTITGHNVHVLFGHPQTQVSTHASEPPGRPDLQKPYYLEQDWLYRKRRKCFQFCHKPSSLLCLLPQATSIYPIVGTPFQSLVRPRPVSTSRASAAILTDFLSSFAFNKSSYVSLLTSTSPILISLKALTFCSYRNICFHFL